MRCDKCPLDHINEEDPCPISDGEYGLEHKDGTCGCRHSWNWCKKRYEEYRKNFQYVGVLKNEPSVHRNNVKGL